MKIASSSQGIATLRWESEALRTFRADPNLQDFCKLLPVVLAEDHSARSSYIVQQRMTGEPGSAMLGDHGRRERALASAATAIADLHIRTASNSSIDDAWLTEWINRPIEVVLAAGPSAVPSEGADAAFEAIRQNQRAAWAGRVLSLGWGHGNFRLANTWLSEDGDRVTGIVGWGQARRNAPAALDLCHLLLTTRMSINRQQIGDVVCDLLREPCWSADERRCFAQQSVALAESDTRSLVLLTWLLHIAANCVASERYVGSCLWTASKIDRILCSF